MTIAAGYEPITYTEDGATASRAISFPFIDAEDLVVTRLSADGETSEVLTLNEDYTVTGGSFATGTLTLDAESLGEDGSELTLARATAQEQLGDYGDNWPVETIEQALDRLTMIAQEQAYAIAAAGRAVIFPAGEAGQELPAVGDRATFYLKFDEDGNLAVADPAEEFTSPVVTINMTTLDPGQPGTFAVTGTWPNVTWNIALPAGPPGLPGALSNGTYGIIVVTDDGATLGLGANTVALDRLVAAASTGFIGSSGAGNYNHRTAAQVTAALNVAAVALKGLCPALPAADGERKFLRGDGLFTGLPIELGFACSDEATPLTAGTNKFKVRAPCGFTLTGARASLSTAQAGSGGGGLLTVDVHKNGTTVFTAAKLVFDNGETTTVTAATPAVIDDDVIADNDEFTVDIDQIGDGSAKGLKIWLYGTRT